jgi:NAD(P) transhydrogenase subunit beta
MSEAFLSLAWVVAGVLFISSLRGLSHPETSRRGNGYGIVGMLIAVGAALLAGNVGNFAMVATVIVGGGAIGTVIASRVAMTAMPELVAILHSFVGLAAVLVGFASYLSHGGHEMGSRALLLGEIALDVLVGSVTFTGSVVAFLKLRGSVSGKPLLLPGRHVLNALAFALCLGLAVVFVRATEPTDLVVGLPGGFGALLAMTLIAFALGAHLVLAIGGADMPVVVSMLNSYSGWTASAAGFMLGNDLLIITGALVGSSGAILSHIMCRAMNRSLVSVIFGGFGAEPAQSATPAAAPEGEVKATTVADLGQELADAKEVVVVPGYGMAVARAQHAVRQLVDVLKARGCRTRFAIHPVAGRLPGHMNVLLAEANVPYDLVLEMDEINGDFPKTDVVLVIGANDIVNPAAQTDASSPIYGMPVLEVWNAARTVVVKRSRAAGYAGIDNPLFYHERTRMLFADARKGMEDLVAAVGQRG